MKLDTKYRRILQALEVDARQTEKQIAKSAGISRDSAHYRLNRLEEEGVIEHYMAVINTMKLGWDWYRTFFSFGPSTIAERQEFISAVKRVASWSTEVQGTWDVNTGIFAENPYEFRNVLNAVLQKHGGILDEHETSVVTRMWHYPRTYLPDTDYGKERWRMGVDEDQEHTVEDVDEIDMEILRCLAKDARRTTVDVARQIDMSESAVRYRLKNLEESGVILGYKPLVNTGALDLKYFKVHIALNRACEDAEKNVLSAVHRHRDNIHTTELINGADLEVEFLLEDIDELHDELDKLKARFDEAIVGYDILQYTNEHQFSYLPPQNAIDELVSEE